ncbi:MULTISPECIES: hypothetical protein [unclassified Streptomyces]|uniref:hypothetical protein n=1 Tax=unclassified Streptomyces TaxID=2593676 RepID=UPI002E2C2830|nr:hypothetical protein [Streptomyces sp. NBC_00223]
MRSKHHRIRASRSLRVGATAAALVVSAGVAGVSSAAAAVVDPAPIGPQQWFFGQVNGVTTGAVIQVGCFGPITPGETGHPVGGQTVDVLPGAVSSSTTPLGYTGDAHQVAVDFGVPTVASKSSVLSTYAVRAPIPTSIELPCYGTGTVVFTPVPANADARPSVVPVTYVSIGLSPAS